MDKKEELFAFERFYFLFYLIKQVFVCIYALTVIYTDWFKNLLNHKRIIQIAFCYDSAQILCRTIPLFFRGSFKHACT